MALFLGAMIDAMEKKERIFFISWTISLITLLDLLNVLKNVLSMRKIQRHIHAIKCQSHWIPFFFENFEQIFQNPLCIFIIKKQIF